MRDDDTIENYDPGLEQPKANGNGTADARFADDGVALKRFPPRPGDGRGGHLTTTTTREESISCQKK